LNRTFLCNSNSNLFIYVFEIKIIIKIIFIFYFDYDSKNKIKRKNDDFILLFLFYFLKTYIINNYLDQVLCAQKRKTKNNFFPFLLTLPSLVCIKNEKKYRFSFLSFDRAQKKSSFSKKSSFFEL
jgi:hypothetical protein